MHLARQHTDAAVKKCISRSKLCQRICFQPSQALRCRSNSTHLLRSLAGNLSATVRLWLGSKESEQLEQIQRDEANSGGDQYAQHSAAMARRRSVRLGTRWSQVYLLAVVHLYQRAVKY